MQAKTGNLQRDWEGMPVFFCPSPDGSDGGYLGDETEQDENEHPVIGMGNFLF